MFQSVSDDRLQLVVEASCFFRIPSLLPERCDVVGDLLECRLSLSGGWPHLTWRLERAHPVIEPQQIRSAFPCMKLSFILLLSAVESYAIDP